MDADSSDEEEFYSADESLGEDSEGERVLGGVENVVDYRGGQGEKPPILSRDTVISRVAVPSTVEKVIKLRKEDDEVEFIVKNLDTGESFSSKEIEKFIPKGIDPKSLDPIAYNILGRSPSKNSPEEQSLSIKKRLMSKIKETKKKKEPLKKNLFAQVSRQHMDAHKGAIWVMKFSYDGTLLATGGNDSIIRIWKVIDGGSPSDPFFSPQPVRQLCGHSGDVLGLNWSRSRSNLLLSCSMDKTVRKWEVNSSEECRHTFEHEDVVTGVEFHPKNEEQFVTGCLDSKIRIWNIRDGKVICVTLVETGFITAIAFDTEGDTVVVGSYDGACSFYKTEGLQYKLQKSLRHPIKKGKKITGINMMPGSKFALVSGNDSRVRLYNMKDNSVAWTCKGFKNESFQISATFSEPKAKYLICGSEDHNVYMWRNEVKKFRPAIGGLMKTTRVVDYFQAHTSAVTVAIFAPFDKRKTSLEEGQIVVSADVSGELKVFENKPLSNGKRTTQVERGQDAEKKTSKARSVSN